MKVRGGWLVAMLLVSQGARAGEIHHLSRCDDASFQQAVEMSFQKLDVCVAESDKRALNALRESRPNLHANLEWHAATLSNSLCREERLIFEGVATDCWRENSDVEKKAASSFLLKRSASRISKLLSSSQQ